MPCTSANIHSNNKKDEIEGERKEGRSWVVMGFFGGEGGMVEVLTRWRKGGRSTKMRDKVKKADTMTVSVSTKQRACALLLCRWACLLVCLLVWFVCLCLCLIFCFVLSFD